ncbi:mitotic spindle assembly checkpoint protein MAD1-like [Varroa jacobsoni]|uniref:mitotic spindle assembly checkpoint protein MAD1-like n=1 Tax=Varroa jacobsoni TaxID=62625 RepID=UPI000BF49C49|nr:mitotic spindle assembly checkpoint protein MAD1-like [Varroa jacobsoni]XP_022703545.1 mitotic spindle assembly checkpoint protein MAD1-like [Varroa jacobsoni]XP_022703546.1 mitotic spindle assembly checkpoint protein MAD1-like [Varroa jacobsoni]
MSVQRLINGRVADAVTALRGACAELDKSISSSQEVSLGQDDDDELRADQVRPNAKRRRTQDESCISDEESVRELKIKLAQYQTKILALEAQKEMQVPLLHRESIQKEQKILELSKDLEATRRAKTVAIEMRTKQEQEVSKERILQQAKVQSLQREIQQLRMRIDDLEKTRDSSIKEAEQNLWREKERRLKEEETAFQKERLLIETKMIRDETLNKLRLVEETLRRKQDDLDNIQEENKRLNNEVSQLKKSIQDHNWASDLLERSQELTEKMKIMAEWETELNQLRKENRKLREDRSNVLLYREQLRILEDVEKGANKTRERCAELEFDLNLSQQLNSEWENALREVDPSLNSPEAVLKRLRKLQDSELYLLEENNGLKTEVAVLQNAKRLEGAEEAKSLKRLERRLRLVAKERDSYKAVLDSYESDVTINPASMHTRRIVQLEAALSEYRAIDAELRGDGQRKSSISTNTIEVQTETSGQTGAAALGDCKEYGYRILHFRNNPLDVAHNSWIAEMKEVDRENKLLRAKVQAFEEQGASGSMQQPGETTLLEFVRDDPRKLRAELESANKKMEKILAAFKKTSREFRQAVYCLTGYRIDMKSSANGNACVLRHMYAESADDLLEFEIGANGFLHLLSNDYSLRLNSLTSDYLEKMDSIPAFLAALTLQLFNSQTMIIQSAEQPSMFVTD